MKFTFKRMCAMLAARNCYESGMSVKTIAGQAKVSERVVRKWLKDSNTRMRAGK